MKNEIRNLDQKQKKNVEEIIRLKTLNHPPYTHTHKGITWIRINETKKTIEYQKQQRY